jgi:hypothetical protein
MKKLLLFVFALRDMKFLNFFTLAGLLLSTIACGGDTLGDGQKQEPGDPDKVVKDTWGTLHYLASLQLWAVNDDVSAVYILKDFDGGELPTDALLRGRLSGKCYLTTDHLLRVADGTAVYYTYDVDLTTAPNWSDLGEPNWNDAREPDLILNNRYGELYYIKEINTWAVSYFHAGSIDAVDVYLLKNFDGSTLDTPSQIPVTLSGNCYAIKTGNLIPGDAFPYGKTAYFHLFPDAGTEVFYTHITHLIYE